ncbi:hypothetical protein PTKIN_Ptkin13bG0301200 [Pterospermum kingtungense]
MASPPPPGLLSSPMAPDDPQQDDHLLFSRDRNFALHGEIMMLIFLLLFAVFLSFLLFFLYIRRSRSNANLQEYSSDQISPTKFSHVQPKAHFGRGSTSNESAACVASGTVLYCSQLTMPPKHKTSPNPVEFTEPCKASLHKRSASDSLVCLNMPYLVGSGSFQGSSGAEGCLKLNGGDGGKMAIHHNIIESETQTQTEPRKSTQNFDPNMDPKKLKRLLMNRASAHKSRLRKLDYIEKLKNDINTEQARISFLAPQVAFYEHKRMLLQKENNAMKQKIKILEKEEATKAAEFQALKDERDVLSLTYFLMKEGI